MITTEYPPSVTGRKADRPFRNAQRAGALTAGMRSQRVSLRIASCRRPEIGMTPDCGRRGKGASARTMKKVPRVSALCDFLTGDRGVRHDFPAAAQVRHSPEQEERHHLSSTGIRPRFAFPGFESVIPYSDETFFPISKRIDNTSPSSGRRKLAALRNLVFAEGVSFPRIPLNLWHREPVMRRKFFRVRVF